MPSAPQPEPHIEISQNYARFQQPPQLYLPSSRIPLELNWAHQSPVKCNLDAVQPRHVRTVVTLTSMIRPIRLQVHLCNSGVRGITYLGGHKNCKSLSFEFVLM